MQDTSFYNRDDIRFNSHNQRRNSFQNQEDFSLASIVRPESLTRQNQLLGRREFNCEEENWDAANDMKQYELPLNGQMQSFTPTQDNYYNIGTEGPSATKTNIKQYIFSTIDNVLGGGQSSTAQIAQNMSTISNNLSNVAYIPSQFQTQQYHQQQPNNNNYDEQDLFCARSAPNTIRPQMPKLHMKFDKFGMNALEDGCSLSPRFNKQQKTCESKANINNTTMISSNISGDNLKADKSMDNTMFSNAGIKGQNYRDVQQNCMSQPHQLAQIGQAQSKKLFENPVNYLHDEFQIKKMKSYNDAQGVKMNDLNVNTPMGPLEQHRKLMSAQGNELQSQNKEVSGKKRSRKAYIKKNQKIEDQCQLTQNLNNTEGNSLEFTEKSGAEGTFLDKKSTSCSVKATPEIDNEIYNDDSLEANDQTTNDMPLARLTNKKKQYLQDSIFDKNGAYSYLDDPVEYKKARKRLQNRESAVRSRQRKKSYQEELEQAINEQNAIIEQLSNDKKALEQKNAALSSENEVLKQQVSYFEDTFANSSLVGGMQQQPMMQPPQMEMPNSIVRQEDLDQFKLEILQKINRRFFENGDEEKTNKSLDSDEHQIKPESYESDVLLDRRAMREPLEQLMAEEYADYAKYNKQNGSKRARLNSGSIMNSTSASSNQNDKTHDSQDVDIDNIFTLKRDQGSNKGYFFLAVVFGMMCCSSYMNQNGSITHNDDGCFKVPLPKNGRNLLTTNVKVPEMEEQFSSMNLIASDVSDEQLSDEQIEKFYEAREQKVSLRNTAHLMKNPNLIQQVMNNKENIMQSLQGGQLSGLLKTIISGKYTYLTYLMCSTVCFFFWMTPNHYKLRLIKPSRKGQSQLKKSLNGKKDIEMEF